MGTILISVLHCSLSAAEQSALVAEQFELQAASWRRASGGSQKPTNCLEFSPKETPSALKTAAEICSSWTVTPHQGGLAGAGFIANHSWTEGFIRSFSGFVFPVAKKRGPKVNRHYIGLLFQIHIWSSYQGKYCKGCILFIYLFLWPGESKISRVLAKFKNLKYLTYIPYTCCRETKLVCLLRFWNKNYYLISRLNLKHEHSHFEIFLIKPYHIE